MRYRKSAIGLSLFLVLAMVSVWMVFNTLRRDAPGPNNSYSAIFSDVSGLKIGDDVRVAGVRVGRVDDIELEGTAAKVTFRVQRSQVIYDDTVASVTYQNIIGQRYVGLSAGASKSVTKLPDKGRIPVQRTRPSFDISNLLNGFEPLFSLLDPKQMDNLTTGIIQALQGDSGSVLSLLTQTSELAETLAGPDAVLGEVIDNLNTVMAILATQNANLKEVIVEARDTISTLAARRDQLVTSVGSIDFAVSRLAEIVSNVYPDLRQMLTRQPGFLNHLTGEGRERFSMLATNLILIWKGLGRITQSGAYVDGYLCDINSTLFAFLGRVIPGIVRLASPGNIIQHSPICSK